MNKLTNLLLLGSSGRIGTALYNLLSENYNVITDKMFSLDLIISEEFLCKMNINVIVNCIGNYNNRHSFFHSNVYVPTEIVDSYLYLTSKINKKIKFIHLSSLGICAPYTRLSLKPVKMALQNRSLIDLDQYEFSKLVFDYYLSKLKSNNYFEACSLLVSNILWEGEMPFKFKVSALLSPFRLQKSHCIPLSTCELIAEKIITIVEDDKIHLSHYFVNAYNRYALEELMPNICFSKLRPKFPLFLLRLLVKYSSSMVVGTYLRFYIFLYLL